MCTIHMLRGTFVERNSKKSCTFYVNKLCRPHIFGESLAVLLMLVFKLTSKFWGGMAAIILGRAHMKPEWGPPLRVCDVRGPRPVPVAEFDTNTGWALQQAAFENLVPGVTVETAMADLRK